MAIEAVTTPESHWNHADPAAQPDGDEVIGVGRMVADCRIRLGTQCTQDDVLSDLRNLGIHVTAEQVNHFWNQA